MNHEVIELKSQLFNYAGSVELKRHGLVDSLAPADEKVIVDQEKLIEAYQTENERLSLLVKSHEQKEAALQASFFDKQEKLNKEMNRLRNAASSITCGDNLNKRKSVEELRQELDNDGKIRYMQDKIGELEHQMIERERSLLGTIDKYKEDCRTLTEEKNSMLLKSNSSKLEAMLELKNREINELRHKIKWYQENQQILEKLQSKIQTQNQQLLSIRNQLVRQGLSPALVNKILSGSEFSERREETLKNGQSEENVSSVKVK
jgi:hypothetical protein